MTRLETFTFRVDKQERQIIDALSEQLKRTRSDAVRWVIREWATSLAEDHYVTSTNRTLVTLSDNILKIKDNTVELPFGRYTAPIIHFINNKIYVTTTDLQTSKVYLYDSQGKSISDFPVYGSSPADLKNIDKDSALELVVKGGENSILLYELN